MKYAIISGSSRSNSQSKRISLFIQNMLNKELNCHSTEILSLEGNKLPLWDEGLWSQDISEWNNN